MNNFAEREYLGDGVYVSIEHGMLKLFCAAPSESNTIFLEPFLVQRLNIYWKLYLNSLEEKTK